MSRPPDPYHLAVELIRRRLRSGQLVQGEQLRVSEISDALRLSGSPVREALSRLAGEGLIEDRRGAGYFAWRLDAVDLAELYGLQAALLLEAVAAGTPRGAAAPGPAGPTGNVPSPEGEAALDLAEAGLSSLIRGARSQVLLETHLRLADRLAPARRVEPQVLPDLAGEWLDLAACLAAGAEAALRDWIGLYRRRRAGHAAALVAAMRAADDGRRRI
jgi:DNA-binding transcriptional MocR family regulator